MSWSPARAAAHARIKAGEGFIYAAHVKASRIGEEHIKVGFSLNPVRRVYRDLGLNRHDGRVRLLGFARGSILDEKALHDDLHGRPRTLRNGNECYPVSILCHPKFPASLIFGGNLPREWLRPRRRPDAEAA